MKELKLVKEKTPVDQIKASEIDLNKHIVFGHMNSSTSHYILIIRNDKIYQFVSPIGGIGSFSQTTDGETLEDFLFRIPLDIRIFEI